MKKFLSMFAFAAAIVLGAFTLASCGDDDDKDPAEKKYSFTYDFELKSGNPEIYNDPVWEEQRQVFRQRFNESSKKFNFVGTDLDAGIKFMEFTNSELYNELANLVNESAKKLNDPTISVTIRLLRDGQQTPHVKTLNAFIY